MKRTHRLCAALLVSAIFTGCRDAAPEKSAAFKKAVGAQSPVEKFTVSLAKLDPADRKLAESQGYCAVENENRLGSMGAPVKIIVKDVCCKWCENAARADPNNTVATVTELKKKSAESPAK